MHNNILRAQKVKSRGQITQAVEHNLRLRDQHNIDGGRSHLNQVLANRLSVDLGRSADLGEKLIAHYEGLGVKPRKDSVLMLEFVVSASPEWFQGKSQDQVKQWADHQLKFFAAEFGEAVKLAVLHLDEKTPHLHFMVGTEHKSVKRYKNQKGEFFKENWSLNAKRFDRQFLIDFHTRHAKHNQNLGLKRGVRGSMRKHTDLKQFYATVNKALSADYRKQIEKTIDSLETSFLRGGVSLDELREKFSPMMNKLVQQNKVLKTKFEIDFKSWAEQVSGREKEQEVKEAELTKREEELKARREVYVDAINRVANDAKLIQELQAENKSLKAENVSLRPLPKEVVEKVMSASNRRGFDI